MIIFELVLLGDFNRNKNNLEENQGFVKLSAKPQLARNECFSFFSPLASYVESIQLKFQSLCFLSSCHSRDPRKLDTVNKARINMKMLPVFIFATK